MKKKAQIQKLTGIVIGFLVLTLVLAIGLNLATEMALLGRSTLSAFDSETNFTALNSTAVALNSVETNQLTCSGVIIRNSTGTVLTSEFTTSNCAVTLTNSTRNNTVLTANYTYTYYGYDANYNATSENITSITDMPGWIPIIIIALIGGLIIMLIVRQYS